MTTAHDQATQGTLARLSETWNAGDAAAYAGGRWFGAAFHNTRRQAAGPAGERR